MLFANNFGVHRVTAAQLPCPIYLCHPTAKTMECDSNENKTICIILCLTENKSNLIMIIWKQFPIPSNLI